MLSRELNPDCDEWIRAAFDVRSARAGLPLDFYRVGHDFGDPGDCFCSSYGLSASGATLVRPDGFVAWRAERLPPAPGIALRRALDSSLGA